MAACVKILMQQIELLLQEKNASYLQENASRKTPMTYQITE